MFFLKKCAYAGSLFKILNILEFNDKVALGICFLISKILHKTLSFESCSHSTRCANQFLIIIHFHFTKIYVRYWIPNNSWEDPVK